MRGIQSSDAAEVPATMAALSLQAPSANVENDYLYELVPLKVIPCVDLSISVKSRLRSKVVNHFVRIVARSRLTYVGFMCCIILAAVVFVVPTKLGRILAVLTFFFGLPATLLTGVMLRYELVIVLMKTYDIWFFSGASLLSSILLAGVLRDVRGVFITAISWLAFQLNIFIDANLFGLRQAWIANVVSTLLYAFIGISITTGLTEGLQDFSLLAMNGHSLPTSAIVRDGTISMLIVVLRNVFRRFHQARIGKTSTSSPRHTVYCVSLRCQLRLQPTQGRLEGVSPDQDVLTLQTSPCNSAVTEERDITKTCLRCTPLLGHIDSRSTVLQFLRIYGRWRPSSSWYSKGWVVVFNVIGFISVVTTCLGNIGGILQPVLGDLLPMRYVQAVVELSLITALICSSVCILLCQRQLLGALIQSFEFGFAAAQITIVHLTFAEMFGWSYIRTVAVTSTWLWNVWFFYWDALMPATRVHLGLTSRLVAWSGILLMLLMITNGVLAFFVLPPSLLNDRVLLTIEFGRNRVEFRALSNLFTSAATSIAWCCRLIWRLWYAQPTEMVILDAPVEYDSNKRSKHGDNAVQTSPMTADLFAQLRRA